MIQPLHQRKTYSGIAPTQNLPRVISPQVCLEYTYPCPRFTHTLDPGLIPVLKKCLARSHANRKTEKAVLCHEKTVHVATQLWDLGWGCGYVLVSYKSERRSLSCHDSYRNFLMACTALMEQSACPAYLPLLEGPPAPGVRHLQGWIEDAWSQGPCHARCTLLLLLNRVTGYDKEGSDQLKHQLVGTRKWIGTGGSLIPPGDHKPRVLSSTQSSASPSTLGVYREADRPHLAMCRLTVSSVHNSSTLTSVEPDPKHSLTGSCPTLTRPSSTLPRQLSKMPCEARARSP
jgi:hypothetical protein